MPSDILEARDTVGKKTDTGVLALKKMKAVMMVIMTVMRMKLVMMLMAVPMVTVVMIMTMKIRCW